MAGKPSKQSEKGEAFLKNKPESTAEQVARASGLTVSAVMKTMWWKKRHELKESKQ